MYRKAENFVSQSVKNKFTYKDRNYFKYFPVTSIYSKKCSRNCEFTKCIPNVINKNLGGGDWRKLHV
jgi:hypothetical protein